MKFSTIWTMRRMSLAERLRRTRDWAARKVAARLPVRLRYWVAMIEIGKASYDSPNVPATTLNDIIENLEAPKVVA